MSSFYGIGEEQVEDEELELYGLNEDEEDSDEEREAVEQAMFMRIHYAAAVIDDDNNKQTEMVALNNTEEASVTSENKKNADDLNIESSEVNINVSEYKSAETLEIGSLLEIEKPKADDTNVAKEKDNKSVLRDQTENSESKKAPNNTDDSVSIPKQDGETDRVDSKYIVTKLDSSKQRKNNENLSEITGKSSKVESITSKNVADNSSEIIITSGDNDSDVCVLDKTPTKQVPEVIEVVSDTKKKTPSITKIDRSALFQKLPASSKTVDGQNVKQRTWKGNNTPPTTSMLKDADSDINEIPSDTSWMSLRERRVKKIKTYSKYDRSARFVVSGAKQPVEDSEGDTDSSDCMLIGSMSEDEEEDLLVNFVTPLGADKTKQGLEDTDALKDDGSKTSRPGSSKQFQPDKPGFGSKGPKCFKCSEFGHPARYCPHVQSKKNETRVNQRPPSGPGRYFQTEETTPRRGGPKCMNCYEFGHLARDCPEPKRIPTCVLCGQKGHFDRVCPDALCFKCCLPGHRSNACHTKKPARFMHCVRCDMRGHDVKMCPDIWRQYHLTMEIGKVVAPSQAARQKWWNTKIYCCNCGQLGHHGYECEMDRMDNYTPIAYPFVWCYDTPPEKIIIPFKTKQQRRKEKKMEKKMKQKMEQEMRQEMEKNTETNVDEKMTKKRKKQMEREMRWKKREKKEKADEEMYSMFQTKLKYGKGGYSAVPLMPLKVPKPPKPQTARQKKMMMPDVKTRSKTKKELKDERTIQMLLRRKANEEKAEAKKQEKKQTKKLARQILQGQEVLMSKQKNRRERRKRNKKLRKIANKIEQQQRTGQMGAMGQARQSQDRKVEFVCHKGFKFNYQEPF